MGYVTGPRSSPIVFEDIKRIIKYWKFAGYNSFSSCKIQRCLKSKKKNELILIPDHQVMSRSRGEFRSPVILKSSPS